MKSPSFIKENAKLQEFLNPINEEYYGNLLLYIRGKSFLKDETVLEGALLEILQDILDAQENGETAEDYFGKQPKEIADELLKETPNSILSGFKVVLLVLIIDALVVIIPTLASPDTLLDIGKLLISGLYWTVTALIIVWQIGIDAYTSEKGAKKYLGFFFTALLLIGGVILSVIADTQMTINTEGPIGIAMIIIILVICGIFLSQQSDKAAFLPFIPLLILCATIGILFRITFFQPLLSSTPGKISIVVLLLLGVICSYFLLNRGLKNKRTDR